jgi:hypothetical protein
MSDLKKPFAAWPSDGGNAHSVSETKPKKILGHLDEPQHPGRRMILSDSLSVA